MKKFLSLVLALVMTMSLVTISAGAKDFTDGDKVNYAEAIDVMSAVKVIDGYTDGSFKPQTQLNRGQAAKIICNMVLGPTTASALKADAAPFKDVAADNTFAGYIAYCVQAGLIDGYTDGTYKPTAPLTGYAFMKYLLGVLGYDKDVEGYNGTNWSINVAKQALAIGLDDGLVEEFDGTKIVTREEACLFAFNAMKAPVVEYSDKTEVSAGGVTITTSGNRNELKNDAIYPDKLGDASSLQFSEKYFKNLRATSTDDAFGRPATEWTLKAEKIGTYVKTSQLLETYTDKVKSSTLYDLVGSSVAKKIKSNDADLHVYMNGAYTDSYAGTNGKGQLENVKLDAGNIGKAFVKNSSNKIGGTGVKTEVFLDDSGARPVVTIVSIGTYVYQADSDYNAKKETVKVSATGDTMKYLPASCTQLPLSADDFDIADVKADDYLLLTIAFDSLGNPVVKSVTPAETITGVVNTFSQDGSNVTVGGTKYDYAFATDSAVQNTRFTVGQEAAVVMDTYGNVIYVAKAVVNSNYVFIRKTATTSALATTALADAYFTDGTKDEITLKEVLGKKDTALATAARNTYELTGWYTFSKNSAGKYTLTEVEDKYNIDGVANSTSSDNDRTNDTMITTVAAHNDVVLGNKVVSRSLANGDTVYADNATLFVVRESDGTVTTYTGIKNVPDIKTGATAATVSYLRKTNGLLGFVFIELAADATIEGSAKSDLLYVLSYDGRTWIDDNDQYDTYKVLDENAESTSVKTDGMIFDGSKFVTNATKKPYGLYRNTRTNSDGYVTSAPIVGAVDGAGKLTTGQSGEYVSGIITSKASPVEYSNETIWIDRDGGTDRYVLADDAKIVLVGVGAGNPLNRDEGASYEASVVSGKALASAVNGYTITGYYQGVLKSSTSNVITTLYVTVTTAR